MNSNKIFDYHVMIKESHLDSFGHVNNTAYLQLYEEARWDFITRHGFGLDVILKEMAGPVILDLQVRFKREIKNRESILIQSQSKEIISSKIMILEQKMINAGGKIASEALFTVGFFDMKERKLVEAPEKWLEAVGVISR